MTGTIRVVKTRDWLTPFEVHIEPDRGEGQPTVSRFSAASRAQENALANADRLGYTLTYLDDSGDPMNSGNRETSRTVSPAEFARRFHKICNKCKESKPLVQYGEVYHRNRTTGREVHHGYTNNCLDCGGE